jgi:hypothetical protein
MRDNIAELQEQVAELQEAFDLSQKTVHLQGKTLNMLLDIVEKLRQVTLTGGEANTTLAEILANFEARLSSLEEQHL